MTTSTTDRVVEALVHEGLIDEAQRGRGREVVAHALSSPAEERTGMSGLVEVVAYLGAALVLAAGALFMVQQWEDLRFLTRAGLVGFVALALAVSGAVMVRVSGGGVALQAPGAHTRRRLASTLLVGSAVAAAFFVGLVWDHQLPQAREFPSIYWPVVAGAVTLLVGSAVSYLVAPTALGQAGMVTGAVMAATNLVDGLAQHLTGNYIALAFFGLGVVWLALSEAGVLRERTVARAIAAGLALLGAQVPVMGDATPELGYVLTGVVVVAGVALYLRRVAWPFLAAAVLGVTLVVPEMVTDWTEGSLGAVGGVLVAGLTLLVASFAGYRLRSETGHSAPAH